VRARCALEKSALRAGILAHQIPTLISICDQVFMGTEEKKGSVAYWGVSVLLKYGGRGGLTVVNMRTEYRRTILAIQLKAPSAKMARRADFSRPGRWMLRSSFMGRMRIQMSRRMFVADVTVPISLYYILLALGKW